MTLPYPYETEKGELRPHHGTRREPFDIGGHIQGLVAVNDTFVSIAGHRLRVPAGKDAQSEAERVRRAMHLRFLKRRPHANEATWRRFINTLRADLSHQDELDEALQEALRLIDGL